MVNPLDAVRHVLVEACGPAGGNDGSGQPLSDTALLRRARIATHPDRHGGDRRAWDRVEEAAKRLGITS